MGKSAAQKAVAAAKAATKAAKKETPVETSDANPPTPPSAQAPVAVEAVKPADHVTDLSAFGGVPRYILPEPPNVR